MKKNSFSWTNDKLEAKDIKNYGKGVFAVENIKKDEVLAVFGGYVSKISDEEKIPKDFNDNGIQISENLVLGIKNKKELELASYFNHSCNPNAGIKGQIFLVAMKDIGKNDQINFDYAMCLHKADGAKKFEMRCLCGDKDCRGIITEDDWKLPQLQKKYTGYFQQYLEEKIKKLS